MALEIAQLRHKTNAELAWDRVRALKPLVLKCRVEGDAQHRLPDAIAKAFLEGDFFRFQVPEEFGGLELDPLIFFDLCVELASYDGSVGWNFGINAGSICSIATLPLKKLAWIFSSPDCGIAGSIYPPGKAEPVTGGYRFTGQWAWASGVHNARWVNGTALVCDGDQIRMENGEPVVIKAQFAREDITVLDAWHTGGMKGTGSTEFFVKDHFVPDEDTFEPFGEPSHPAAIFHLPISYLGMPLAAVTIGIARGTAEAFKDLLLASKSGLKDQTYAQYALAKAEALHESAQLHVRETFRPIWEDIKANRAPTLEQRARARRAYVLASEVSIEAVKLCYSAAGGAAIFDKNPFHRNLSDVHVASAHQLLQRKIMEQAGQVVLGMPLTNPVF
jgi:indole-3-acetate monooxygenase